MTIRERIEADERRILGEDACLAVSSRGRVREEEPCPMRTCFQRDRDRICLLYTSRSRLSSTGRKLVTVEAEASP